MIMSPHLTDNSYTCVRTDVWINHCAQMGNMLAKVNLQRCYRHLKEDLLKHGKATTDVYDKLVSLPKCNGRLKVADRLYKQLPRNSPLRNIPKPMLAPAYLPDGACTHGVRTNNAAEVFNSMALVVRQQETPYRSLLATVQLLHHRRESLVTALPSTLADAKVERECDEGRLSSEVFVPRSEPPRVRDAYALSRSKAMCLACPEVCDDPKDLSKQVFMVESSAGGALNSLARSVNLGTGYKWPVSIAKFQQGDYEGACGCGRTASGFAVCHHVLRVVMACRQADLLQFRKPWQVSMFVCTCVFVRICLCLPVGVYTCMYVSNHECL